MKDALVPLRKEEPALGMEQRRPNAPQKDAPTKSKQEESAVGTVQRRRFVKYAGMRDALTEPSKMKSA